MAVSPIGCVLGGVLSPNSSGVPGVGQCVIDVGANVWLPWNEAQAYVGHQIGIVITPPAVAGTPMQVMVSGTLPYAGYNIGGGNASDVVAGVTPSRGSSGQIIGQCDPAGEISLFTSYLGVSPSIAAYFANGVVLRPGGVAGGNVYTSWPVLYAAAVASGVQGQVQVTVDNSLAAPHITAGSWAMGPAITWSFVGIADSSSFTGYAVLTLDDGAHFVPSSQGCVFNFAKIELHGALSSAFITCPASAQVNMSLETVFVSMTGASPFVDSSNASSLLDVLSARNYCVFGDGTHAVFDGNVVGTVVHVQDNAIVESGALGGTGTIVYDATAFINSGALGSWTPAGDARAVNVGYVVASSANWNNVLPTDSANAFDRIAAGTTMTGDVTATVKPLVSFSGEVTGLLNKALPGLSVGYLNYTGSAWALTAVAAPPGDPHFGSGTDGSPVLDGINTFSWATLVGTVYTMTRSIQVVNLTVNAGITLKTAGMGIYGTGTLTGGGNIDDSGAAGSAGTGGAGTAFGAYGGSSAGGNIGSAGVSYSSHAVGFGGLGGTGGAGTSGPGSAGGSLNSPVPLQSFCFTALQYGSLNTPVSVSSGPTPITMCGGSGGGGGSLDTVGGGGGAGGGGGGYVVINFASIGNITIHAQGGAGQSVAAGGGGAGGGGGVVILTYRTVTGTLAVSVAGGAGGTGAVNAGANGAMGTYLQFNG